MDLDFIFEETFKSILILVAVIFLLFMGSLIGSSVKNDIVNYGKIKIGDDIYSCIKDDGVR